MKKNINNKLNIKSEKGFTIQDLIIALFLLSLFVTFLSSMMYSVYLTNAKTNLTSQMATYAVQILEDIDKISYEEVNSDLAQKYHAKFNIPEEYNIDLQVSNYGEGVANIQDVMKIVNLTISYTMQDETEQFSTQRLKIKEM